MGLSFDEQQNTPNPRSGLSLDQLPDTHFSDCETRCLYGLRQLQCYRSSLTRKLRDIHGTGG